MYLYGPHFQIVLRIQKECVHLPELLFVCVLGNGLRFTGAFPFGAKIILFDFQ